MRAIELFAGAGGLGIGVSRAGFSPQLVVEWDRWCCDTIRENRGQRTGLLGAWPEPVERDVRMVSYRHLRDQVELVTGGPPCQPFSLGGRHRAHADARDMWSEAVRAVRETRPWAFIFENVKGLTRESFASYFLYIQLQLNYPELVRGPTENWEDHLDRLRRYDRGRIGPAGLEYRVDCRVMNAANYGIPQKRERVIFVGFRCDMNIDWAFPPETHSQDALIWDQVRGDYWERHQVPRIGRTTSSQWQHRAFRLEHRPASRAWRTTRDAIGDLPDPELNPVAAAAFNNHRFQPGARAYPGHTGSPLDEPAKTLKAGVHGVPGGENMLACPDGTVRYFTVRESARLQTFPDDFRFHGSWSETMRQLGNAVPVQLAEIVAKGVKRHLVARQSAAA